MFTIRTLQLDYDFLQMLLLSKLPTDIIEKSNWGAMRLALLHFAQTPQGLAAIKADENALQWAMKLSLLDKGRVKNLLQKIKFFN